MRQFRWFVLLLAVLIPLRAMAVASVSLCASHPSLEQRTTVSPHSGAHQVDVPDSVERASGATSPTDHHTPSQADPSNDHKSTKSVLNKCGNCAPCHAGVAGPPKNPDLLQAPYTDRPRAAGTPEFASALIEMPRKPPRVSRG